MSAHDSQRNTASPLGAAIQANADVVRRNKPSRDFLKELGLSLPVTPTDVKQAFRERAKQAHPDRQGGSIDEFRRLQAAFDEALEFAQRNGKRIPWIGNQMPIYIAQRKVVEMVESLGGTVEIATFDWLADTVGEDFAALADRLISIDLSDRPIGDAELRLLTDDADGVRHIELLFLAGTQVTDDGILEITAMRNLRYIDLRNTPVSGSMRKQIARLERVDRVEGLPTSWWRKILGG
jgi:hypothetical protein